MDKLFHDLKNDIPEPSDAWLNQTRNFVLSRYESKHVSAKTSKVKSWWRNLADSFSVTRQLALKPVAITAVLLIVVLAGPLSLVVASQDALPGDNRYAVKKITNSFKRYLTVTKINQARQEIVFVGGSVADLRKTIDRTESAENKDDQQSVNNIKLAIEAVQENVAILQKNLENQDKSQNPKSKEKAIALAHLVTQQTAMLNKELSETRQKLASSEIAQTIEDVEDKLSETNRDAIKVLAQGHKDLGGKEVQIISRQELVSLVEEEILHTKNRMADLGEEKDFNQSLKGLIEEQTKNVESKLKDAEILIVGGDFYMAMNRVEEASDKIEIVKDIIRKVVDLSENQPEDIDLDINNQLPGEETVDQEDNATSTQAEPVEVEGEQDTTQAQEGDSADSEDDSTEDVLGAADKDAGVSDTPNQPVPDQPAQAVDENIDTQDHEYQVKLGE